MTTKFVEVNQTHSPIIDSELLTGVWPVVFTDGSSVQWLVFADGIWKARFGCIGPNCSQTKKTNDAVIIGGIRKDEYIFVATRESRGKVYVRAGCRVYTFAEARKHWSRKPEYWVGSAEEWGDFTEPALPSWKKAIKYRQSLNAWSLKTIDKLEAEAIKRGWIKAKQPATLKLAAKKKNAHR